MAGVSKNRSRRSDLDEFPRPSVAVDVAVCSVVPDSDGTNQLSLMLIKRRTAIHCGQWSLPGSFMRERERLADAVKRTLRDKCDVEGLEPHQLEVCDDPDRDDRGWVLSVAHLDTVPIDRAVAMADRSGVAWIPVRERIGHIAGQSMLELPDGQETLPFDHDEIVRAAVAEVRRRYQARPDPGGLLSGSFTVLELRRLHEAIAGRELQKDTFRRAMARQLVGLRRHEKGTVGPPARLYRTR